MQSFSLVDNNYMKIVYDEDVTVIDARLDDTPLRGNPDGTVTVRAKLNKRKENGKAMDIDDLIFQGEEVVISEK